MVRIVRVVVVVQVMVVAQVGLVQVTAATAAAAEVVRGAGTKAARLQLVVQLARLGAQPAWRRQRRGGRRGGGREDALAVVVVVVLVAAWQCGTVSGVVVRMLVVVVEVMVVNIDTGRMGVHNIVTRGGAITAMHPALVQAHGVCRVHVHQVQVMVVVVVEQPRLHHHRRWQWRNTRVYVVAAGRPATLDGVAGARVELQAIARPNYKPVRAGTSVLEWTKRKVSEWVGRSLGNWKGIDALAKGFNQINSVTLTEVDRKGRWVAA